MNKDLKAIVRMAKAQGWRVEQRGSGHLTFYPPDPKKPFIVSGGTPSDYRALLNLRAHLRRAGLVFADEEHRKKGVFKGLLSGRES